MFHLKLLLWYYKLPFSPLLSLNIPGKTENKGQQGPFALGNSLLMAIVAAELLPIHILNPLS